MIDDIHLRVAATLSDPVGHFDTFVVSSRTTVALHPEAQGSNIGATSWTLSVIFAVLTGPV